MYLSRSQNNDFSGQMAFPLVGYLIGSWKIIKAVSGNIHLFIHSFVRTFIHKKKSFRSCIYSSVCILICYLCLSSFIIKSFTRHHLLFIYSFNMHLYIASFGHSFMHSFILFVQSIIYLFLNSFINFCID